MKIETGNYTISISRKELIAIEMALDELSSIRRKFPIEENGYDVNTAALVEQLHGEIIKTLKGENP